MVYLFRRTSKKTTGYSMIDSKKAYLYFLKEDERAMRLQGSRLKNLIFNDIWLFLRLLRKMEYVTNCNKNKLVKLITRFRLRRIEKKLGFSIPINTFDCGLSIPHYGNIVVNAGAKIGKNCRIHVGTNIGTSAGKGTDAPDIGDNCYIGPGAKIFGKIKIGDNTAIGANAVVTHSFESGNCTIAGIPAKIISNKNSLDYI